MKIEIKKRIARPVEEIWNLVADDFTSIQRWSASVITSTAITDRPSAGDAPIGGRYCTFTDDPDGFGAREVRDIAKSRGSP